MVSAFPDFLRSDRQVWMALKGRVVVEKLKYNHRLRIDVLAGRQKFSALDQYLQRLSEKGFDVAGVPFRLVDGLLSTGAEGAAFQGLLPIARHTVGGQPRLLTGLLGDLNDGSYGRLERIVSDTAAHSMTRFEAMGWAVYSGHRAEFPSADSPVLDVFQFWDQPVPPKEVLDAKQLWMRRADAYVWYDDLSGHEFIKEGFGETAAKAYSELWHPALKSDVFRLYRLAKNGGLYCDADGKPGYQIPDFLRCGGERVWASSMTNVPNCVVNNWFVAAPPCHPFIEAMLDQVLRNIHDINSRGIFWLSGPGAFTTFLYQNIGKYDVGLLPQSCLKSELFRQFDADYKHTEQNWRVYEHKLGLNNDSGLRCALRNV